MVDNVEFSNAIGLPEELVPLLVGNWAAEYASLKKDGTPVTVPLIPFPGQDGRTIDLNTGLTYPTKAERARNNPRVCLLYSEPRGSAVDNPPVVLAYGHAAVHDAHLQDNTDRIVRGYLERMQVFSRMPRFMWRQMVGYLARIWIAVTPLKVLWWPGGDMDDAPKQWNAPEGTQLPPSDPKPKPLAEAHKPLVIPGSDWRSDLSYAIDVLGIPVLTVVDNDGYPVPFRVKDVAQQSDGAHLNLLPAIPAEPEGRACITFHTIKLRGGSMISNDNMTFLGSVSRRDGGALFAVERRLPGVSFKLNPGGLLTLIRVIVGLRKRLAVEAARRGQPVPVVRLPDEVDAERREI